MVKRWFWCTCLWVGLLLLPGMLPAAEKDARKLVNGGVGLQVVPTSTGEIVVLGVLAKSPAATAGLLPGDLIVAVNDAPLRGTVFTDITRTYLWGKVGSKVRLHWLRPGVAGEQQAELTRAIVPADLSQNPEVKMLLPPESGAAQGKKP